jgi:hypothetical protein
MTGYAEPIQIMSFSSWLANALGLPILEARFIEVAIIFFILFFPIVFLKLQSYILITTSVLSMSFLTAMGVLDFWIWAIIALYVAYNLAHKLQGFF